MSEVYDVIVVGAGPGGATAAYFLGEAGKRVLVLEKETLPRYKACGGGVSARLLAETFPFDFEPVIERHIGAVVYALNGWTVAVPVPRQGVCTVMRGKFDAHILAHARAEVRPGIAVRSVTEMDDRVVVETADGQTVEGRYLIGADGANSVVARSLKLRRRKTAAAALEAEVPVPPETLRRFGDALWLVFGDIGLGYAWVFPKAAQLSVGIASLHPKRGELQAGLVRFAARYGLPLEGVQLRGHPVPVYTGRKPIGTARTLLVGDAADLVDPLTGEGIRLAIKSGRLAAQSILAGQPGRYATLIQREIGMCHTLGRGVATLFYHVPYLCYLFGLPNPFVTRAFVDMLADHADYFEVVLQALGTLPVFMLTEAVATVAGLLGGAERRQWVRTAVYSGAIH